MKNKRIILSNNKKTLRIDIESSLITDDINEYKKLMNFLNSIAQDNNIFLYGYIGAKKSNFINNINNINQKYLISFSDIKNKKNNIVAHLSKIDNDLFNVDIDDMSFVINILNKNIDWDNYLALVASNPSKLINNEYLQIACYFEENEYISILINKKLNIRTFRFLSNLAKENEYEICARRFFLKKVKNLKKYLQIFN